MEKCLLHIRLCKAVNSKSQSLCYSLETERLKDSPELNLLPNNPCSLSFLVRDDFVQVNVAPSAAEKDSECPGRWVF